MPLPVVSPLRPVATLISLSVRGVVVPSGGGRRHAAVFAGASTGSGLAAAGTVGLGVPTALAIATLARAY